MSSKYDNFFQINQFFGKYKVIDQLVHRSEKGYAQIKVQCECGKVNFVDARTLVRGNSRGCLACSGRHQSSNPAWKGYKEIPGKIISRTRRQALQRGIVFDIKIEDIWNKYIQQNRKCALTDLELTFGENASIDRIDSSCGYIVSNIQIVHKDINLMKNHFDENYFVEMCKLVANKG